MHEIEREHPEYRMKKSMWRRYRHLYSGGEEFQANAAEYLVRRYREPAQVYAERLSRCYYENYIGSIIDWYAATLFRREPVVHIEGCNERGRRFFNQLTEDCDLKGTSLSDFFRKQLVDTLVGGASYIVVDFPRTPGPLSSRAEEEALGASRAFLVNYTAEDLINWSVDPDGAWEWVVFRTQRRRSESLALGRHVMETRWIYYDREQFRIYRSVEGERGESVELVDSGFHGLAKLERVPVFELKVSDGLWLMNKAASLQMEHFNKSNALSWALTMGLFAMPVVYSERPFNQMLGESYFLQLGPEDRFGWTEPQGHVFKVAVDNLARLKEEIYRVCYLLTQAGGTLSGNPASGLSKQRDFSITQEVLRAYGDAVKDVMKRVLRTVEAAREDGLNIDVSGLDEFDIGDFSSELADAERLLNLGIESKTLRKQVFRKLAFKYLCDIRQDVKDRIGQEIESWCERSQTE
jgi:hypothetical protein